jgi:hypothetical protein
MLAASRAVAVGLEIPTAEQPFIDTYLTSRGTASDRRELTRSAFWQRDHDGRSSVAMLRLIDDVRVLKDRGTAVDVFAFDEQPGTALQRDVAIANGIRRFSERHPGTQIVALMGNLHASREPVVLGNDTIVPSGKLLDDLRPVSIAVAWPKGTVWACIPDCGIHEIDAAKSVAAEQGLRKDAASSRYDYIYSLLSITAAPPAIEE